VAQRNVFLAFRVVGAVIVVPLMEELFWRAFLIRWLINENFKSVPVGAFTWLSFAVTAGLFGAEHSEWLAGLICGVLYNGLYYKRKDVFSCVVAHAVSNAALAVWVLSRGDWKFW
jgi:CAAX prenyl protease-like protein